MARYVKAVFDFPSTEVGDLPFHVDDIIQVIYDVDDNWLCGKLNGSVGNFPKNFVTPLDLPELGQGQNLFVAVKDFYSDVPGDLPFRRGDVIIGLQQIDPNWWHGSCNGASGIFPITHVEELQTAPNTVDPGGQSSSSMVAPSSDTKLQKCEVIARGRANMDLTAQLDDELSFYKGDIIDIVEVIDSDFAVGINQGSRGSFPLAFVDIFDGSIEPMLKETKRHSKFDWWKECNQNKVTSERTSEVKMETAQSVIINDKIGLNYNGHKDIVHGDGHISSVAPDMQTSATNGVYDAVSVHNSGPVDSDMSLYPPSDSLPSLPSLQTHRRNNSYNQQNTCSQEESGITPYGKILFPFVGENPNELTVFDNEIVTLIRHVDDQWIEGEVEGKRGIFPASYVEIIVDCPYDYESTLLCDSTDVSEQPSHSTQKALETYSEDVFGCVLYDFVAENDGDLNLHEGETIKLLSKINEDWYQAQTDDGHIGMCPVNFIEVIPAEPPVLTSSPMVRNGDMNTQFESSTNNIKMGANQQQEHPTTLEKPNKPSKPPILRPKPSLKGKAKQKSSTETQVDDSGDQDKCVAVLNNESTKPPNRPPKPSPVIKEHAASSSLEEVVQKELERSKLQVGVLSETVPSADSGMQHGQQTAGDSPSYIQLESSTLSASYRKVSQSTTASSSIKPLMPSRPPPIPETKRVSSSPKKTPPPRPRANPTPQSLPLEPNVVDLGPKPIPQRAAPPRPAGRPTPSPRRKTSTDDLMEFSPDNNNAVPFTDENIENMEVIQDLERRIDEAEKDLQKYEKLKTSEEEALLRCDDETERTELKENIDFYRANVDGLAQEIIQLKEKLFYLNPERALAVQEARQKHDEERLRNQKHEALRQKHRETRQQVISEIIETEKDYLHSISLCFEAFFHTDVYKCSSIDIETLLGNLNEVCEVSQMLLTKLEAATNGKLFEEQLIGPCFIEVQDEMKRVYAPYCRNHDDVLTLLAKYEKDPEIQACFNQMIEFMREKMSVFDLGSVLIKPVQRILKYPLLLNELLKSTEEDHPDKVHLVQAINSMTEVAAIINEYKRRKDLVLKYKNTSDVKFREKMAKLTMHSTKKKLQRFSQMVVGVQTVDENFIREERKFKSLESAVRVMVRDVSGYVESVQLMCQAEELLANDISDYYSEHNAVKDVEQFCKVHSQIAAKIYYKFKEDVEMNVITPLNRLLAMFQGPVKVIKKRYDKLLDYDNLSSRVKNLRDSEQIRSEKESLQMAKNNYEALNAQLLDELPQLYKLSLEVIYECIGYLVLAQKQFYNSSLEEMYQMLGLQLVLGHDVSNIIETFNICHARVVEQLSDISFIPKSFNPLIEERRAMLKETKGCSSQSDSVKAYLRQRYPADRLYTVTQTVGASQAMDLELAPGVLVGVIKETDPMGNKEHWFVDTGDTKGFVMKHFLSPCQGGSTGDVALPELLAPQVPAAAAASPTMSENLLDLISLETDLSPSPFGGQRMSFDKEPDSYYGAGQSEEPVVSVTDIDNALPNDGTDALLNASVQNSTDPHCYQAVYSFQARSALEVDLIEGEPVYVLEFHDQDGNDEWWLVETNGKRGYAPANYLYKIN